MKLNGEKESLLLQLPSEILEYIIYVASKIPRNDHNKFSSWQYPEHSYPDLKFIALSCKRLYILCTPYLWRDKEFILPAESDKPTDTSTVHKATDILGEQAALSHHLCHLGSYVRSLCRDLTNSPHYDLPNSSLMAHLVCNLRALRIDFHPKPRTEHYGLRYFAQCCPSLSELYLDNCRDTFDDFYALIRYQRKLRSLTLLNCTVKADTLLQLADICRGSLQSLFLQRVWIEPVSNANHQQDDPLSMITMSNVNNMTTSYLHSKASTFISPQLYTPLLSSLFRLTQLALSDSISLDILETIAHGSPCLERLAIAVHEQHPLRVTCCLLAISHLQHLTLLSLAFRYTTNTVQERLPCCAPAMIWTRMVHALPRLHFLHVSATQLLVNDHFILQLLQRAPVLQNIMLHHIVLVPTCLQLQKESHSTKSSHHIDTEDSLSAYEHDLTVAQDTIESWQHSSHLRNHIGGYILSLKEAERKGFDCFDSTDRVCFVKGFDDWIKS